MSRSRRYWPPDLQDDVFIKRPHAIDQLLERANYPSNYYRDKAEEELRAAVVEEIRAGRMIASNKNHSTGNDFVVRVEIQEREVVYPLVERGEKEGKYQFMVHTVFSREMYQQWSRDGKLGSVADLPAAKAIMEIPKSSLKTFATQQEVEVAQTNGTKLLILYVGEGGVLREKETTEKDLTDAVLSLLMDGTSLRDMRVLKEIEFDLKLQLKGS